MSDSINDLVAQFLAKGGSVKSFPGSHEVGRPGRLLGIMEIPKESSYRNLGAFRLKVHFNDTNTEANVACKKELREGLEIGKEYKFPTECITPQREEIVIDTSPVLKVIVKRLTPHTTALRLIAPAVPS